MNSHGRESLVRGILMGLALALALTAGGEAAQSHVGFFGSSYTGAQQCLNCHPGKGGEVAMSIHYQLRSENPNIAFPGGGMHGMVDRACALRGTNMLVTYDQHCGACHIGVELPFGDPMTGEPLPHQIANLDCLVCHARVYDMNNDGIAEPFEDGGPAHHARVFDEALSREVWFSDRAVTTAETVGGRVTTDACLRCHEHGQGDYYFKRGTPFSPETDVHAAAGITCTDCHMVDAHRIARGSRVTDMYGWELQDVEVTCTNCHDVQPHEEWPAYNLHTDVIACETCHIPWTQGVERRVWTSTYGIMEGAESDVPTFNSETGEWDYYEEVTDGPIRPVHRWFTGGASMLAEPMANPDAYDFQPPTEETPGAMIYPFRNIVNGMVMDRRGIAMDPEYDPSFTMLAAFEAMSPQFIQMGFMRPSGLNEAERNMLSMFPNLLMFDRAEYIATGDVTTAVSLAMGTMGAMMNGMDWRSIPREQLIQMGEMGWSGQPTGLDLPDNPYDPKYVADMDPRTVTGSFIQLSHSITREGALRCVHCHTPEGVMDFTALYSDPGEVEQLENMLLLPTSREVLDHLTGTQPLTGSAASRADVNQDHLVSIGDVVTLMNVER